MAKQEVNDDATATVIDLESRPVVKTFTAAIRPGDGSPLPTAYTDAVEELSASMGMPVWLLAADIERELSADFRRCASKLPVGSPVALLLTSHGGDARAAYEIGRQLRRSGGFIAVVPDYAMSAATLLALGADQILMAGGASLGPLDVQIWDKDLEEYTSGLNEVQALERLRAYALDSVDESMFLLMRRIDKRVDQILPHVLKFVSDTTRPLFESIDVVHYNERARILRVAESYATRLLSSKFGPSEQGDYMARQIAARLVEQYPEHGFMIDVEEAVSIGLDIAEPTEEQVQIMERLWSSGQGIEAAGPLEEVTP